MEEITHSPQVKIIAMVAFEDNFSAEFNACNFKDYTLVYFENGTRLINSWLEDELNIAAVVSNSEIMAPGGLTLNEQLKSKQLPHVPFFLVVQTLNANLRSLALASGVTDVFTFPLKPERIQKRVFFLLENWEHLAAKLTTHTPQIKKIDFGKRCFDIVFASMALIFLSPIFIITYILIKLESKGPAFYYSLRAGAGFKVFKFYKFRSMYVNADQRVKDLKHLNQYDLDANNIEMDTQIREGLCSYCAPEGKCQFPLYSDNNQWCEKDFKHVKSSTSGAAFFKIKNDPRITKVGNFIRNTSIDELPQLWNVIIGDMSIVGNRPLPLYEAEKLTTDKYVLRFAAPAGITGLWQVEKRGKKEMSEEERLLLDNVYAQNHSIRNDLRIILKTIPALFQKESV
ncbi:sugar transferase [Pedobacter sp. MW01-1-1]|uniref:sugar transferase n=1 Tax=Pedobacter sp. MW01-1-1 TaxID=3383027 RepID=UPI003FEFA237